MENPVSDTPTTARNRVFQKNPISEKYGHKAKTGVWAPVRKRLPGRITGIAIYVLPIYVTVYVINALGWFEVTRKWLVEYVTGVFIPKHRSVSGAGCAASITPLHGYFCA